MSHGRDHSGNVRGRRVIFLKHPGNRPALSITERAAAAPPPRPLRIGNFQARADSHHLTPSPDSEPFQSEPLTGCAHCPLQHEEV